MYDWLLPRLPCLGRPFSFLLTLVFLVDERTTVAPQPAHDYAIHEQRNGYLRDLVATWGEGGLMFQYQQPPQQEEWYPGLPPPWTLTFVLHRIGS